VITRTPCWPSPRGHSASTRCASAGAAALGKCKCKTCAEISSPPIGSGAFFWRGLFKRRVPVLGAVIVSRGCVIEKLDRDFDPNYAPTNGLGQPLIAPNARRQATAICTSAVAPTSVDGTRTSLPRPPRLRTPRRHWPPRLFASSDRSRTHDLLASHWP
jgi:hypothetical protein